VVTMQETFGGIRVVKSFGREEHQMKSFERSNRIQFGNAMRIVRSIQATGPLVESIAAIGVGFALFYVYSANLPAPKLFGLICGIFLLYDPIKTLSRLHVTMQRSVQATEEIFRVLDSTPTIQDRSHALVLPRSRGLIEFDHITFRYAGAVADAVRDLT